MWWGVIAEVSQCFLDAEAVSLSRAVAVTTAAPPVVKLQARTGWAALQAGSASACEKKNYLIFSYFPQIFLLSDPRTDFFPAATDTDSLTS